MLIQLASQLDSKRPMSGLFRRLRGIAHAPIDFDYKTELANRYSTE